MSENLGHFNSKNQAIHRLSFFKKKRVYHIRGDAEKGGLFSTHIRTLSFIGYLPPPRFKTIYGAGSVEKKIDLYNIHVYNPEGCCFMVSPDLVRSV